MQNYPHRIAMFVPSLRGGGAERVMLTLASGFANRGFMVDLIIVKAVGPYLSQIPKDVRVVTLNCSRLISSLLGLIAYLRREKPSVMLSAMKHANVMALLAAILSGAKTPVIVSEHSTASVSLALNPSMKTWVLRQLMRLTYPMARGYVAVSSGVANDLSELLHLDRKKIETIFNPVISIGALELANKPLSHPWFGVNASPVILSAGRLTLQKDFPTLIKAFSKVRKQRSARLVILGEGECRVELESLIVNLGLNDDVSLPGFVDNPYQFMRLSALFVLSSQWEGFGNVLVEAMACGTPVVSTDCPSGPSEILEDGKWGKLVPVGDADALSKAMLHMLDHPRSSSVHRAMDFSADKAIDAYQLLLMSVCKSNPEACRT